MEHPHRQITERLTAVAPRTVRGRTRTPAAVRNHARLAVDGPVHETWKLGYLIDTIYLRDLWMHRIDAVRALGRPPELSADHDGRITADIVAEWARRKHLPSRAVSATAQIDTRGDRRPTGHDSWMLTSWMKFPP